MGLLVVRTSSGHELQGTGPITEVANRYLAHLQTRGFASGTIRGYAFDLLNFSRFLVERSASLDDVVPTDLFDYLDWQARAKPGTGNTVVRLADRRGAAPSTMNRRIAAVRGLFEFSVIVGLRADNPVPAARRSTGLRPNGQGNAQPHWSEAPSHRREAGATAPTPAREPGGSRGSRVHRDRAITLAMLVGGLRAAEVRSLRLADVDMGLRQVRVTGKGGRERTVPVDKAFFVELGNYLRTERPAGCTTAECFVVLRGPTAGHALTEAGMRRIFRTHRSRSGATRVRPHRLRHTYGTELATAGIDLLVLRELMGHASPETTAGYVHLSAETLAAEFARARESAR